ncbi:MAG TPA: TetR/AcrR family transcriptional regulator [Fibrobacteria bacterium]|nr:TetR/AcrR family transcriptional regulator [Fibrobacteria bacterium]
MDPNPGSEPNDALMVKNDTDIRQRIMCGARELFFRYGFSKVTMDEAAESLGMSKKTLYKHFPSKETLLQAVSDDHVRFCGEELRALCARKDLGPLRKLRNLLDHVAAQYARMSDALVHDLQRYAPGLWKQFEENRRDHIFTEFAALIKEGRQKGIFRKDVDERLFLLIYFETVHKILHPETLATLPFKPSQVFDAIVKVLFEGLLTDKSRAEYHAKT